MRESAAFGRLQEFWKRPKKSLALSKSEIPAAEIFTKKRIF
jgi:hypothetical protein